MTEPDNLSGKIRELMAWQAIAWRRIADPEVTTFERREIRNSLRACEEEVRRCLAIKSEQIRRAAAEARDRPGELKFRVLAPITGHTRA
jgi:hypothetical protein